LIHFYKRRSSQSNFTQTLTASLKEIKKTENHEDEEWSQTGKRKS